MKRFLFLLILFPFLGFSQFVQVTEDDGLFPGSVSCFVEGLDGSIWTGGGNGVTRNNSGVYQNYNSSNGLLVDAVTVMSVDQSGNIWVGSLYGVSVFNGNSWLHPSYSTSTDANNIRDIEIADNGDVWLATGSGIWVYDGDNYSALTIADGLPNNSVKHLAKTTDGTIWAASFWGLSRFDNPGFTVFTTEQGLSSNNIKILAAGIQVYAYSSGVLNVFNGFSVSQYNDLSSPISSNDIVDIRVEANQDVWLAYEKEIIKLHDMEVELHLNHLNTNLPYDAVSFTMQSLVGFSILNGKVFLGSNDGYRFTYNAYLNPDNLHIITDTININEKLLWNNILGISDREDGYRMSSISMFLAGIDEDNQLHMSGGVYNKDWSYGPVIAGYNTFDHVNKWHRTWKLHKSEIETHKSSWNMDSYVMSNALEHWPDIADYLDSNSNGVYDPENGDYPIIRGDQAILSVINDNIENEIGRQKMKVEVQTLSYAFQSEDSALSNTGFINYKIINRSENDYSSVYLALYNDFDLGSGYDDYMGSDTSLNAYYIYNGDDSDATFGSVNIPADGVVFLNTKMTSSVYLENDNFPYYGPYTTGPLDHYNFLLGYWADGTAMTYGGNACGGDSAVKYVYTGDPLANTGWTESLAGNDPGDRRALGVVGPFNLESGQEICIDVALVRGNAWNNNHLMSIKELRNRISHVHSWYANQDFTCDSIITVPETDLAVNALDHSFCGSDPIGFIQLPTVMYGGEYPFTYAWTNETGTYTSELISPFLWAPETTTDYYVTVTDNAGASVTDTLTLSVIQPEISLADITPACVGETVILTVDNYPSIEWSNGNETESISLQYNIAASFFFSVTVTDVEGCSNSKSTEVLVNPLPEIDLGEDIVILDTSSVLLNPNLESGIDYLWSNGSVLNSLVFNGYNGAGEYNIWLHITDEQGCVNGDSIQITVEFLTSINEIDDYIVKVYPNPSSELVFVDLPQKSDYILFNLLGQPIQKGIFNTLTNQLKVSQLTQGTYFLYIEALNIRKKLIIQ